MIKKEVLFVMLTNLGLDFDSSTKKENLIRLIQKAENNESCYNTKKSKTCGQEYCLWKNNCQ